MRKTLAIAATAIVAVALILHPLGPTLHASRGAAGAAQGLVTGARLAAIYDLILDARFDNARTALNGACPPAPAAACDALREVALWWEIQQNQESRLLDTRLDASATAAIASATSWTEREPTRGEAWFYLAGAYAPLSQWRVLRGERLAAARDGKRIKDALERALALDASLQDAWFGIGLYHYYADVAPAALKFLRFLLLLPGGDRAQGLQEMLRARQHGQLLRGEADYQLHWIYLWYEQQPDRALALLKDLDAHHPSNPLFLQRIASVQHEYFSDHQASADSWRTLLDRAARSQTAFTSMTATRARVGLAAESIELSEPARAIELLDPIVSARPSEPYGVLARAYFTQGEAFAALGNRNRALDSFTRAIDSAPHDDPEQLRARARAAAAKVRSTR